MSHRLGVAVFCFALAGLMGADSRGCGGFPQPAPVGTSTGATGGSGSGGTSAGTSGTSGTSGCDDAGPAACGSLDETDCLARTDCQAIYDPEGCAQKFDHCQALACPEYFCPEEPAGCVPVLDPNGCATCECQQQSCTRDSDCPSGDYCAIELCNSLNCPNTGTCEPVQVCPVLECPEQPAGCIPVLDQNGCATCECQPQGCWTDSDCPQGDYCQSSCAIANGGIAYGDGGSASSDAGPFEPCPQAGTCQPQVICPQIACAPADPTDVCFTTNDPNGCPICTCQPSCQADTDCPNGSRCEAESICNCPAGAACDCPAVLTCVAEPQCSSDSDCRSDETCEQWACPEGLPSCSQVPPGTQPPCCDPGGQCVAKSAPNCGNLTCAAGEVCAVFGGASNTPQCVPFPQACSTVPGCDCIGQQVCGVNDPAATTDCSNPIPQVSCGYP